MRPVVLITGAAGLIGHYLIKTALRWAPEWDARALTRREVDLTRFPEVDTVFRTIEPQAVIHCAAVSRTRDCEQDPKFAHLVNVGATAHLAGVASDIPFLFISSGEVFDGAKGWYNESDEAKPINVYGETKLEAERIVLRNPRHSVLRIVLTAGTSSTGDRSFVEHMCRAAQSGKDVTLYADEFRCPLPAGVIARAIWELMESGRPGLYHLGGRERLSRWEIGEALLPWYPELNGRLVKASSRHHAGAPRPADLSLQCDKLQQILSFPIPGFREWLTGRTEHGKDLWDYPERTP
ncbi:MAG TPA: SDR family oxidoreductase [Nitrospira sp.]|nr:SDR family oxidoreductase [Nitrospira sp.]